MSNHTEEIDIYFTYISTCTYKFTYTNKYTFICNMFVHERDLFSIIMKSRRFLSVSQFVLYI